MPFTCRQCGTCCMYMGECIEIGEQINRFEFFGICCATGTSFHARVDDDKRDLFLDRTWIEQHPSACPFLRPRGNGFICTIHETSPMQCRAYRCTILRIAGSGDRIIGSVTGTLALHTDDVSLRAAWEEAQKILRWSSPDIEEQIARFFRMKGYAVCD